MVVVVVVQTRGWGDVKLRENNTHCSKYILDH